MRPEAACDDSEADREAAVAATTLRENALVKPAGVASWLLTGFLLAGVAGAAVYLQTTQFARRETVTGELEPSAGALRIVAGKPGVVSRVFVSEGSMVARGAPIVSVTLDPTTGEGAKLGGLLKKASEDQKRAISAEARAARTSVVQEIAELEAKRTGYEARLTRLGGDLEMQKQRIELQASSLESFRILNQKKIVSDLQFRERADAVVQAKQAESGIIKEQGDLRSNIEQLGAEIRKLRADADVESAKLRASDAELEEKQASFAADATLLLTAPSAGRVVAITAKSGAAIVPASAVAVVLPQGANLEAVLWAPSRAAGFVKAGDDVRLLFDAFPYQKFGVGRGKVRSVSTAPVPPSELPVPMEFKEPAYRIVVALERQDIFAYGKRWPFEPGMRVTADLILDRRSLLEWALDPFLAAGQRAHEDSAR